MKPMPLICNICGETNTDESQVCVRCGVALQRSGLSLVDEFELRIGGRERATFHLSPPQLEGYIIGRTDETSDYRPDIDLAAYGGREQGVSRRHAALVRFHGAVHILDLSSVNGTFLNGKRLTPETPYPIHMGDHLKIGNINLVVTPTRK